jgi:hypothetical protein
VLLNRKIIPGESTIRKVREIASQLVSLKSYLPQHQFQDAMQWHMNNFDMARLTFD